jgi:hypothetical protein
LGGPQYEFPVDTLHKSMRTVLDKAAFKDLRLFFCIDGLDEFDNRKDFEGAEEDRNNSLKLIDFLEPFCNSPHVKLCVASRQYSEFDKRFGIQERTFRIHELTQDDICTYIKATLCENETFQTLATRDTKYLELVDEMMSAAEGVFLWVRLASNLLLDGINYERDISDLRTHLRSLPTQLCAIYDHIINSINPMHQRDAARSFLLLDSFPSASLVLHYYMDDQERKRATEKKAFQSEDLSQLRATMNRSINYRCKNLLMVDSLNQFAADWKLLLQPKVQSTHRTLVEHIREDSVRATLENQAACQVSLLEIYCMSCLSAFNTALLMLDHSLSHGDYASANDARSKELLTTTKCRNAWNDAEEILGIFAETAEKIPQVEAVQHWDTLGLINTCIFDAKPEKRYNAYAILRAFIQRESSRESLMEYAICPQGPDILTLAITYGAVRYMKFKLLQNPTILPLKHSHGLLWNALLRILSDEISLKKLSQCEVNRQYGMVSVLLEHGADPNKAFHSSTSWEQYIGYLFCKWPRVDGVDFELVGIFLKYGAELDAIINFQASYYIRGRCIDDGSIFMHHIWGSWMATLKQESRIPRAEFSLSAAAILRWWTTLMPEKVSVSDTSKENLRRMLPDVKEEESVQFVTTKALKKMLPVGSGSTRYDTYSKIEHV